MKKLIEKYWEDMFAAVTTQNASKIVQHFAPNAVYKFRTANGMIAIAIEDMAKSCLGYKEVLDGKYVVDRIDELAKGLWSSIITSSVSKKPYFTASYFKFRNEKIIELIEYYGDF